MTTSTESPNPTGLRVIDRPETVKERVRQTLEDAILSGLVGNDEILKEVALAEKLNVSRTPVREAFQELTSRGLLESAGVRGKRVRRIRPREVHEVFWLRQALEGAIAEWLARNGLTEKQTAEIERHLENQRAAMEAGDRLGFLAADSSFHIALAEFMGYPKVTAIVVNLRQLLQLLGLKAVRHASRLEAVLAEHRSIVKAIQEGDATLARRGVTEHLMRTEQLVIPELEREGVA